MNKFLSAALPYILLNAAYIFLIHPIVLSKGYPVLFSLTVMALANVSNLVLSLFFRALDSKRRTN